jgi:WD40 repeat protein
MFNYSYAQVSSFGLPSPTIVTKSEQQTIKTVTKAPLNAISASPGKELVVVSGREILKIYSTGSDPQELLNLRGGKGNSSNDVKWAPSSKNLIVSASTSGTLLVFDLNKSHDKLDRTISEHSRAVNRICFNPTETAVLLSASQDGTMRLWDLRTRSKSKFSFDGKSESVRDIQFNPMNMNEFASVFDNGSLQTWDIRNPNQFERKWSAHNGLALTVDWDVTGTLIATGGRDKAIKIWDSKSERRKPVHFIQTIASVARVKWRPGFDTHIASCSLSNDNRIHIWDYNRPFVSQVILDEHENVVTGMLWNDAYSLWSCSKDESFIQHNVLNGYNPSTLLRKNTARWNPLGQIATITCSTIQKSIPTINDKLGISFDSNVEAEASMSTLPQTFQFQTFDCFDPVQFAYFAEYFKYDCDDIASTCLWNAELARNVGATDTADLWDFVRLLCQDDLPMSKNLTELFNTRESKQM